MWKTYTENQKECGRDEKDKSDMLFNLFHIDFVFLWDPFRSKNGGEAVKGWFYLCWR